ELVEKPVHTLAKPRTNPAGRPQMREGFFNLVLQPAFFIGFQIGRREVPPPQPEAPVAVYFARNRPADHCKLLRCSGSYFTVSGNILSVGLKCENTNHVPFAFFASWREKISRKDAKNAMRISGRAPWFFHVLEGGNR